MYRLHYLLSSLKGKAKALVQNLAITNNNFRIAWELVSQRYNNVKLIAMIHVKRLCQLLQVNYHMDAGSLRQLTNHVSSNLNALQALTLDISLQHLILSLLDSETREAWELSTANHPLSSLTEFITFLEGRCKALELLQDSQPMTRKSTTRYPQTATKQVSQNRSNCNLARQRACNFCSGNHIIHKCDNFKGLKPRQRFSYAKENKLCYNCLKQNTRGHKCSTFTCRECNPRHNTLLSFDKVQSSVNNNGNSASHESNSETAPEKVNTYCSLKNQPNTHVLLATAIVLVQNKHGDYIPWRPLLDSASQTHCVTGKLVQRLQLPRSKTRTFVQGISAINTEAEHMVSLNLKSIYNDWHSNANCVILPTISHLTPTTRLDVSEWRLPSDVQLADESFLEPGNIDLLLGADIFYDIQRPGRRTRSSNYSVLQDCSWVDNCW